MNKIYTVTITEVLQRRVPVRAENKNDAEHIIEQQYYNQEHILNETILSGNPLKQKHSKNQNHRFNRWFAPPL